MTPLARNFDEDAYVEAWNAHDVDRILDHMADDVTLVRSAFTEPVHGKDDVRERTKNFLNAFEDLTVDLENTVWGENDGAGLVRIRGTHTNDLVLPGGRRINATGNRVDYRMATFMDVNEEGKITRDVGVHDVATLIQQLGIDANALAPEGRRGT